MKNSILLIISYLFIYQTAFPQIKAGRNQSFDANWKFKKLKPNVGEVLNLADVNFNDANWRKLDLPHDWSIEDLTENPSDSIVGPFYKKAVGKNATAFTVGGTAWYRKHFVLDKSTVGKQVFIQFDGVYMNSDVWVNGHHLGNHPNGYTAFVYELTPYLNPAGKENTVAVQVKNEGDNSRWYAGSGIYRHVWLSVLDKSHIENWGVQIVSKNVSEQSADIHIATKIENTASNISVKTDIYSVDNKLVASNTSQVLDKNKIEQTIVLKNPKLWDTESPNLYKAKITLQIGRAHV